VRENATSPEALASYFDLSEKYQAMYADYLRRGLITTLNPEDSENVFNEDWKLKHYFETGADALRIVVNSLIAGRRSPPATILDFPCGSGRVTRHFLSFFSGARVYACDLYERHVSFCAKVLGARGVMSREDFDDLRFDEHFDVIFCGSLLTHLPESLARSALRLFDRTLSDRGIAVVTLHGRYSEFKRGHRVKYMSDDALFDVAAKGARTLGFGYVDYDSQAKASFDKQASYGITLVRPHWMAQRIEENTGLRLLGYAERDWDNHHDVLVFGKPGVSV